MQTSYSAVDVPSPFVPSEGDVLDRDRDDGGIESSNYMEPYNELHEILSWMPAKSAIKYSSSLCKWLCNIHSEPRFIKKQCIHSCGQDNGFFLQHNFNTSDYDPDPDPKAIEFHVLPGHSRSTFGMPRESLRYILNHGRILSSSNGLLLLGLQTHEEVDINFKFRLCNPATKKWALLGTPENFNSFKLKFLVTKNSTPLIECSPKGYGVEFPNDYTIVFPVEAQHPVEADPDLLQCHMGSQRLLEYLVEKYCWKSDCKTQLLIYCNGRWEEELCDVSIEGRVVSYEMPVAVFSDANKRLLVHYLCHSDNESHSGNFPKDRDPIYTEPYIAAFDISEKKLSREIKLPEEAWHIGIDRWWNGSHRKLWIFKWGETSICLVRWRFYGNGIDVWVLDKYGCEGESWRMIMNTQAKEFGIDDVVELLTGVGVVGKRLLIATAKRVYVYVMEGEHHGKFEVVGKNRYGGRAVSFMPYANTLRPVSLQDTDTNNY